MNMCNTHLRILPVGTILFMTTGHLLLQSSSCKQQMIKYINNQPVQMYVTYLYMVTIATVKNLEIHFNRLNLTRF